MEFNSVLITPNITNEDTFKNSFSNILKMSWHLKVAHDSLDNDFTEQFHIETLPCFLACCRGRIVQHGFMSWRNTSYTVCTFLRFSTLGLGTRVLLVLHSNYMMPLTNHVQYHIKCNIILILKHLLYSIEINRCHLPSKLEISGKIWFSLAFSVFWLASS